MVARAEFPPRAHPREMATSSPGSSHFLLHMGKRSVTGVEVFPLSDDAAVEVSLEPPRHRPSSWSFHRLVRMDPSKTDCRMNFRDTVQADDSWTVSHQRWGSTPKTQRAFCSPPQTKVVTKTSPESRRPSSSKMFWKTLRSPEPRKQLSSVWTAWI